MPEIAKRVVLDLMQKKLFVDGEEFPWHIEAGGPMISAAPNEISRVSLTFFADAIEVIPVQDVQDN